MFQPSSQHLSFQQQVIALAQSYPCPRCSSGLIETYGLTETLQCGSCQRNFVALRGARLLYPAQTMGWKIAPTYWWDGFRWHWAGTTATSKQLSTIVASSLVPVILLNVALSLHFWSNRPLWCTPLMLSLVVGLLAVQMIYLLCWDFDFLTKSKN
jgi:hypothetical protein